MVEVVCLFIGGSNTFLGYPCEQSGQQIHFEDVGFRPHRIFLSVIFMSLVSTSDMEEDIVLYALLAFC